MVFQPAKQSVHERNKLARFIGREVHIRMHAHGCVSACGCVCVFLLNWVWTCVGVCVCVCVHSTIAISYTVNVYMLLYNVHNP